MAPEPTNLYAFLKGNPNGTPDEKDAAVIAKELAIVLGKALFWDMQVGSDDVQACASCHFNAGADSRTKNQLNPMNFIGEPPNEIGIFGDSAIDGVPGPNDPPFNYGFGPNFDLTAEHFPFHRRVDPTGPVDPLVPADEFATVIMDTNDVVSSQGVRLNDSATDPDELIFNWKNANVRKVEPRNAPSMINAVFHLDMFWDGRASFVFNGVNPFGFRDQESTVKRAVTDGFEDVIVRIPLAGHASQSVGPPESTLEMTGSMRNFPELAYKLLLEEDTDGNLLNPLALQMVHPDDSVLGPYAMAYYEKNRRGRQTGKIINVPGTKIPGTVDGKLTYKQLIQDAFKEQWWGYEVDSATGKTIVNEAMIQHNFSLFFGLAMQLYQGTLVADDTPFDRFMGADFNVRGDGTPIPGNPDALTPPEILGLDIFQGTNLSGQNPDLINAGCNNCHFLPETSNHVVRLAGLMEPIDVVNDPLDPVNVLAPQTVLELMPMGDGGLGVYDIGFYNIAVRPTDEDIGRGGTAKDLPLSFTELAFKKLNGGLTPDVAQFVPNQGIIENPDGTITVLTLEELFAQAGNRTVTQGAFKVPTLRNQEFQGPYFHTGGDATLRQVVEFYVRGGNFPATNIEFFDADIGPIPELDPGDPVFGAQAEANIQALVAFLSRGLTDPRVAQRQAPFDHPQLFIPEGITGRDARLLDGEKFKEIKATGAGGAGTIPRFLNLDPQDPIQYVIDILN